MLYGSQLRRCHFFDPLLEGLPASLGPGLRTVSGGKRLIPAEKVSPWHHFMAMPEKLERGAKTQLAIALARGDSTRARANDESRVVVCTAADAAAVDWRLRGGTRRLADSQVGSTGCRATLSIFSRVSA